MNKPIAIILFLLPLLFTVGCKTSTNNNAEIENAATNNQPTSQPVSNEIKKYRAAENEDALNQRQALNEEKNELKRLRSNSPVSNAKDFEKMIAIYKNKEEGIEMRALALKKSLSMIAKDEKQIEYLMQSIANKNEAADFKKEAIATLEKLTYSSIILQKKKDEYLKILRQALENTTDKNLYTKIIEKLSVSHDPFAQQELIRNLRSENYEVLSAIEMMNILKKNMRPDYYPPLHQLMLRTKNDDVKANAVGMLKKYAPSRTYFVKFMSDEKENQKVRLACLKHLAIEDKATFYPLVRSVVMNETESETIRLACLNHLKKMSKMELAKFNQLPDDMMRLSNTGSSQKVAKLSGEVLSKL